MIIKDKRNINQFSINDERESLVVLYFEFKEKQSFPSDDSSCFIYSTGSHIQISTLRDYEITNDEVYSDWKIKIITDENNYPIKISIGDELIQKEDNLKLLINYYTDNSLNEEEKRKGKEILNILIEKYLPIYRAVNKK